MNRELEFNKQRPDEIGFEQSVNSFDYMRISQLIRQSENDDDVSEGGIEQKAQAIAARQQLKSQGHRRVFNQQPKEESENQYTYEIQYDDSSNSEEISVQSNTYDKLRTAISFKENLNSNIRQSDRNLNYSKSHRAQDFADYQVTTNYKEVRHTPAMFPPKQKSKAKKKADPKPSAQMQLMIQKLAQLKEIEKQSKSFKTSALVKGLQQARKFRIQDNPHTKRKPAVLAQTLRHSTSLKGTKQYRSGATLDSVRIKKGKSSSRLDQGYKKHAASYALDLSPRSSKSNTKSFNNTKQSKPRSRSIARMHKRLCEVMAVENEQINLITKEQPSRNDNRIVNQTRPETSRGQSRVETQREQFQSGRSSKSKLSKHSKNSNRSKVSQRSKNELKGVLKQPHNDLSDFHSTPCIEMFANQYLNNGKMSFGVDFSNLNTGNNSSRQGATTTPEPMRQYTEDYLQTQSRNISQYKSNQKDCKVPPESD